jgi:hypothetical protein
MAADLAPGITGVQFHPEAEPEGIAGLLDAHLPTFVAVNGEAAVAEARRLLGSPSGPARVHATLLPTWLDRRFDALAPHFDWNPLAPPEIS